MGRFFKNFLFSFFLRVKTILRHKQIIPAAVAGVGLVCSGSAVGLAYPARGFSQNAEWL